MVEKYRSLEVIRRDDGSSGELIKLPEKSKMLERLLKTVGDESDLQKRFYPLLLGKEGLVVTPEGIVTLLAMALGEYEGMKPSPEVSNLRARAGKIIEALTPGAKDNERIKGIREKAQEAWHYTYVSEARKSEQQ